MAQGIFADFREGRRADFDTFEPLFSKTANFFEKCKKKKPRHRRTEPKRTNSRQGAEKRKSPADLPQGFGAVLQPFY
jgi:hypothetical protein